MASTKSRRFLKGAHPAPGSTRWVAQIWLEGKTVYLGCFDTELAAHRAYLKARKENRDKRYTPHWDEVLTADDVWAVLDYAPETGIFLWKARPGHRFKKSLVGKPAGRVVKGHLEIRLGEHCYQAGRLAWLMMTGEWPPKPQVDHHNTNGTDNRWENLRPATHAENQRNGRSRPLKGASWHKLVGMWRATITVDNRQIHLGYFETAEEAHEAYREASAKYHGVFGRAE